MGIHVAGTDEDKAAVDNKGLDVEAGVRLGDAAIDVFEVCWDRGAGSERQEQCAAGDRLEFVGQCLGFTVTR